MAWTGARIWPRRRLASGGVRPHGGCASGAGCGLRGKKLNGGIGGLSGEAGQATRRGREEQCGPLGRDGEGVLGLGYMGLVRSNVFMDFISVGTLE
jgi:hypothetical protein